MNKNSNPIICFDNVHTYYDQSHILRDVSFSVAEGECLSLMGRNGMGKTTILRTIMGHVRPSHGQVYIKGLDGTVLPTYRIAKQGIAFVPETRGIFPNLSVIENLTISSSIREKYKDSWTLSRVFELFPKLANRKDHWGDNLSGGEQQMLAIGRALLTNPELLLLDEATEGLAPMVREDIWQVIKEIKNSGIACIIVDKHVKKLLKVADRHIVLVRGEIKFEGNSARLRKDPNLVYRHLRV